MILLFSLDRSITIKKIMLITFNDRIIVGTLVKICYCSVQDQLAPISLVQLESKINFSHSVTFVFVLTTMDSVENFNFPVTTLLSVIFCFLTILTIINSSTLLIFYNLSMDLLNLNN